MKALRTVANFNGYNERVVGCVGGTWQSERSRETGASEHVFHRKGSVQLVVMAIEGKKTSRLGEYGLIWYDQYGDKLGLYRDRKEP